VPAWCKVLVDLWLRDSGVTGGRIFRRILKNGTRQDAGVTPNVVWYAVKRCTKLVGIGHLAPPRPSSHLRPSLSWRWRRTRTDSVPPWSRVGANDGTLYRMQQKLREAVNDRFQISLGDAASLGASFSMSDAWKQVRLDGKQKTPVIGGSSEGRTVLVVGSAAELATLDADVAKRVTASLHKSESLMSCLSRAISCR
jgi:hypothetical protein